MHGAVTAGAGAGWCHIQPRVHCSYLSTPIMKRISGNLKHRSSTNLIQFNLCLGLVWEWWMLAAAASCILEAWYFFISAGLGWAGLGEVAWTDWTLIPAPDHNWQIAGHHTSPTLRSQPRLPDTRAFYLLKALLMLWHLLRICCAKQALTNKWWDHLKLGHLSAICITENKFGLQTTLNFNY